MLVESNNKNPINLWLWQTCEHVPFLIFVFSENDNKKATRLSPLIRETRLSPLIAKKSFSRELRGGHILIFVRNAS